MPSPFGQGQGNPYERFSIPFNHRGVDIAHPVDRLAEGRFPYAKNIRAYIDGAMQSRPGLVSLFTIATQPSIHTISRLNDPTVNDFTFLVGAGTELYSGNAQPAFTAGPVATGFSGNPMTMAIVRPDRSPAPWAYVADSNKLVKTSQDGTVHTWGIPEIPATPSFVLTPPKVLSITEAVSLTELGNTWNNSVNAGALSLGSRVNTTITYIVYDSGSTGYCGISPASIGTEIQPGSRLRLNSGGGTDEYVVVEQVFALIANTTIESISYDAGSSGLCWIQLAAPTAGLVPNCLLRLAGTENTRVLEVILDKDNKAAIRCSTTATFAAGATVTGLRSFRCSTANTHAATETITASYIQSTITYPGVAPAGVGNIRLNAARDLSKFTDRQVTDEDEVVVSLYLSDASKLVEGRIWFDIDPNTTAVYAADDLSRNYLFFPFRAEDLQSFASFDLTQTQVSATAQNIQRSQFDLFNSSLTQANRELATRRETATALLRDFPGGIFGKAREAVLERLGAPTRGGGLDTAGPTTPGAFQAGSGKEQWFTLRFKIGQLNRVGQDISRTLKDTTSVMVNFKMSATSQVVRLGSWYISGGSNPDMKGSDDLRANAYYYITQGRDDRTGARSLPSPATRSGLVTRRQSVSVTSPVHPNAQVNKIDFYRWGGSRFEFLHIGSADNAGTPTLVDNFSDDQLSNARPLDFNTFPPFATVDLPFSCVVNVVGPKVTWVSGTKFNTSWSPGILLEIMGRTYILYAQPETDEVLYLTESAGTLAATALQINSPVSIGQPLPTVFGPYGLGFTGLFNFAVGDLLNPGNVYWTNPNDPDTSSDKNYLEVTGPGEPLIGGCIYDGRPYLFSTERMFMLSPGTSEPGASTFAAQEIANSRGAVSPTGIASDVYIYFAGKDGIYRSEGGQPTSITNDSLYSLFPHDGISGVSVNGIIAPDYTRAVEFNLTTYGPLVYFDYPGLDDKFHTLIYDSALQAWSVDEYAAMGDGVRVHYGERGRDNFRMIVGGALGTTAAMTGVNDLGVPIQVEIWLPAYNAKDERADKQFGDYILDLDTGNTFIVAETWTDSYQTNVQNDLLTPTVGRQLKVVDLNTGNGYFAKNLGVKLKWSGAAAFLYLHSWQPSYLTRPEDVHLRATDWDYGSKAGAEWFQGVLITADTGGVDQIIRLEFDQGAETRLITINHNGQSEIYYHIPGAPIIGHHVRLLPIVTNIDLKLYSCFWVTESAPEQSVNWQTQPLGGQLPGWKHLREAWITYTSASPATLTLTLDGTTQYTFQLPAHAVKQEHYLPLVGRKFRIITIDITCPTPLRLFERDTFFSLGPWGRGDAYRMLQPFGGPNADNLSQAYV